MRSLPCALLLLLAFAASASAADVTGNWHLDFISGVAHITVGDAEFEFRAEGNKLKGTAHVGVGGWPANGPISDGTIDGDHISFRIHGKAPSSSGYPKMRFTGTVHGDDMELTMMLFYRDDESDAVRSDFKGKRVSR